MNKHRSALEEALKILKIAETSESKLKEHLVRKGYSQREITEAISFLKKNNLLDDERFAEILIDKYIRKNKGINYIYRILSGKAIPESIISNTLARLYPESLEYNKAKELIALQKKPLNKVLINLVSAGFSETTIRKIMEEFSEK
ncbi:MAG: recombination regulator RecX [Candidatus Omnitrophica bacterium]|nr:recombination regulator RecX [Candidatus Omnitrophota bacterium]MCM8817227.1 recombination regulator RecX [Candidatus Omnitrophota bacterium]